MLLLIETRSKQMPIENTPGGTLITGKGIDTYRYLLLAKSIELYARYGMIPTRGVTISKMMKMASQITGKKFKSRDYAGAAAALKAFAHNNNLIDAMETAVNA
jgi:hypothetical protein